MLIERFDEIRIPGFIDILRQKVVSFDVDGVLADTASLAVKYYNSTYKDDKKVVDLDDFNSIFQWLVEKRFSEDEALTRSIAVWNNESVMRFAKPVGGALLLSKFLEDERVSVHFVTSRPRFTKEWTLEWFTRWLPWVDSSKIHLGESNDLQKNFKKATVSRLSDIHFEDAYHHAEDIVDGTDVVVALVRQPWNLKYNAEHPRILVPYYIPEDTAGATPKVLLAYAALATYY